MPESIFWPDVLRTVVPLDVVVELNAYIPKTYPNDDVVLVV